MSAISQRTVRFLVLLVWLFTITRSTAQTFSFFKTGDGEASKFPKHEVRAVWLTTIGGLDWPRSYARDAASVARQQRELTDILDRLQRAGINTVLLQVRIRGTVIYPSLFEPVDGCLAGVPGKQPGYDALQFAIDECHQRGMELHAWVVTIPVGKWNATGCRELWKKYPLLIKKIGDEGYMDPENRQTATYLADICDEITRNYDVDGIHLDYIRYPETWHLRVSNDEGRRHITNIVEAIARKVKARKAWVKMSCAPIGKFDNLSRYHSYGWNAYTKVCQDAQGWLRNGLMDALFPMMYFQGNHFFPFAIDWSEQSYGRIVVPGLGIYFMSPAEKNWALDVITREMYMLRQYGMGYAFFRSKFFTDDLKGIYSFTKNEFSRYPALVPAITWQWAQRPLPPRQMSVHTVKGDVMLSWSGAVDHSDAPYLLYNVYAGRTYPVDVKDARNLIAVRRRATELRIPAERADRYYAVTATDRYGNESEALQSMAPQRSVERPKMLKCDGYKVQLPAKGSFLDADVVVVEGVDGCMVATYPYVGATLNVARLNNGIYVLRSLNRKGVNHRLGFFMIKRK